MRTETALTHRPRAGPTVANARVYPWIVRAASVFVAGTAAAAMVGWLFDVEALTRWRAALYPMLPLTVVGHLLAGVALGLVGAGAVGRGRRLAGRALASVVAIIGGLTLAQYVLGTDIGLGRLLFPDAVRAAGGQQAGRPAFNSGTGFLAGGLALLLLDWRGRRRTSAAQLLAIVVLLVGTLALIGYAYAVEELYTVGPYTPMSLPSAAAFLVLALGLLFVAPGRGIMTVVTADDTGGYAARRLLPAALLLPFVLGWVRLLGQEAGLYGTRFGLTLLVVMGTTLLAAVVWWNAFVLHRADVERTRTEAERARQTARLDLERRRLQTVLDTLPVGVSLAGPGGRSVLFNDAYRRIWGVGAPMVERAAEYGRYKAWWPDTGRRLRADEWGLARAIQRGDVPPPQELDIESFDGERKTVLNYARPIRDAAGRVSGGVVAIVDITDRRRVEAERERARAEAERRAREEEALRVATSAVVAAFTVEDMIDRIARSAVTATAAETALVERIDPARGEAVIVSVAGASTLPPGTRMRYAGALIERVIREERPVVIGDLLEDPRAPEHLRRAFDGSAALAVPMMEPAEPIGALILIREPGRPSFRPDEVERAVTFAGLASLAFRKVHLLAESEERGEELRRVLESQSRLVRGFSHDVKNPLGAADGRLALLEQGVRDGLSEPQREDVARARRSIGTALRLIDSLVDFARAEAGQITIQRRLADVRGIAREIVEEQRPAARAKGLDLGVEAVTAPEPIRSDPDRIRQILGNLLSNAVKYTERGAVRVRVAERSGPAAPGPGRWVCVDVSDTGPGIPEDRREAVFGEFTRLEPGEGRGAGLGLAISRRLARLLGGDVTLESEVGKGSTFTLWLPREAGADAGTEEGEGGPERRVADGGERDEAAERGRARSSG